MATSRTKKTLPKTKQPSTHHHAVPLIIIFLTAIAGVGFASYNLARGDATVKTYYATLANQCWDSPDNACCFASIQRMQQYGYFQSVAGTCPDGYEVNKLRCSASFAWCAPQDIVEAGPFHKGSDVNVSGHVVNNVTDMMELDGPGYARVMRSAGDVVSVYYSNGDAPCPGSKNIAVGIGLEPGDDVTVFGQALSPTSVSTCPSDAYAITVMPRRERAAASVGDASIPGTQPHMTE